MHTPLQVLILRARSAQGKKSRHFPFVISKSAEITTGGKR